MIRGFRTYPTCSTFTYLNLEGVSLSRHEPGRIEMRPWVDHWEGGSHARPGVHLMPSTQPFKDPFSSYVAFLTVRSQMRKMLSAGGVFAETLCNTCKRQLDLGPVHGRANATFK